MAEIIHGITMLLTIVHEHKTSTAHVFSCNEKRILEHFFVFILLLAEFVRLSALNAVFTDSVSDCTRISVLRRSCPLFCNIFRIHSDIQRNGDSPRVCPESHLTIHHSGLWLMVLDG